MKRAAIYARYSTDMQSERSIDDQLSACADFCAKNNLIVTERHHDRAISGASTHNRPGYKALVDAIQNGRVDVVVVEAVDRLARDMSDTMSFYKEIEFAGVDLMTTSGGEMTALTLGFQALIAHQFRVDNKAKVRRGLRARVKDGLSAGGAAYGYSADPAKPGHPVINQAEAEVVRRIFSDFLAGKTPREIARQLNAEGIAAPRGSRWNASTICGNAARGSGILRNRQYDGAIVWNKNKMVVDPSTGKRVSRANPISEHVVTQVPELRIVDESTFAIVAGILAEKATIRPEASRKPTRLLSGLLKCNACGAGLSVSGKDKSGRTRLRCSGWKESGTCPDPQTFYLDTIEDCVLQTLQGCLGDPRLLEEFIDAYISERRVLDQSNRRDYGKLERDLRDCEDKIQRVVDAIADGTITTDHAKTRLQASEAERARLIRTLEQCEMSASVTTLHPVAQRRAVHAMNSLSELMQSKITDLNAESARTLRELVDEVFVSRPQDTKGEIALRVRGKLNAIVRSSGFGSFNVGNVGSGGGT